jgi:hypothetical protein
MDSSTTLSFRLFADDANIFYASKNLKEIETVMNNEFQNILKYCNANNLPINMQKTHLYVVHEEKGDIINYFLSVKMKQSDWLRSLSERAGFLHPAALKRNCPL